MNIKQLNFELETPSYVDKIMVCFEKDKGWFIHFHKGKDGFGNPKQYTVFNTFVIFGGFGLLNVMKLLRPEDYMFTSMSGKHVEYVIDHIERWTEADYDKQVEMAIFDHPLMIKL